jgi:DNA invertase Pin-like site-specific DNA recombinase
MTAATTPKATAQRRTKVDIAMLASHAPRVYSYIRFSSAKQAHGTSADRQSDYAQGWAKEHGMTLDTALTMRDEGLSAYKQTHITHGALGIFMKAIEAGRIAPGSVLIVEALDRLSRATVDEALSQLLNIIRAGVRVVTMADKWEYSKETIRQNPMQLMISLTYMMKAHDESRDKVERVTRAMHKRATWKADPANKREINRFGRAPTWIEWDDKGKKFLLNSEQAGVVREVVALFLEGYGARRIYDVLIGRGINPRGFTSSGFYRVLRNRALIGELTINVMGEQITMKDYYPAVLSLEQFERVQDKLDGRRARAPGREGEIPGLFTGLQITTCGHCKSRMFAQNFRRNDDGTYPDAGRRIKCGGMTRTTGCRHSSSSIVPLERAIMEFCSDQTNLDNLRSADSGASALAASIARAEKRQSELETQRENLTTAIAEQGLKSLISKLADVERAINQGATDIKAMTREHAQLTHKNSGATAATWKAIVKGVHALDYDARVKARALIVDSFSNIVVHIGGLGRTAPGYLDVELTSRQGVLRTLRVDKLTGEWQAEQNIDTLTRLPRKKK